MKFNRQTAIKDDSQPRAWLPILLDRFTLPLAERLAEMGVKPNTLTVVSAIFIFIGLTFLAFKQVIPALIFMALYGLTDTLDGKIARGTGQCTKFGKLFDITVDLVLFAPLFYFILGSQTSFAFGFMCLWFLFGRIVLQKFNDNKAILNPTSKIYLIKQTILNTIHPFKMEAWILYVISPLVCMIYMVCVEAVMFFGSLWIVARKCSNEDY